MAELVRNGRIGKLERIEVILPLQPNKPGEISQVNDADRAALTKFARADINMRMQLAMRGI